VHRVKGFQHLKVFENLPQGVRARVFLEDTESWKAQKNLNLRRSRRKARGQVPLKVLRRRSDGDHRRTSSAERNTLVSCAEVHKQKNGWSEFSKENS
jgi:hypothetical protein